MARKPMRGKLVQWLRNLSTQQLIQRGRVHVKHIFNPLELEKKASDRMLYRYVQQGRTSLRPIAMSPESIERWHYRISSWKEESGKEGKVEYHQARPPFPVYEFRDGKLRPLRSNYYYSEIKRRHAATRQRAVMKLEDLIDEKERAFKLLEKKRPRTAKRNVRIRALISHNQRLVEMYATQAAAIRLQLFRMEQLKNYLSKQGYMNHALREMEMKSIGEIMQEKTRELDKITKEEFLAKRRIENITEFPKAAAQDRKRLEELTREYAQEAEINGKIDAEITDQRANYGVIEIELVRKQMKARLNYWMASNTLLTEYMKALHMYGVTLSKIEAEDVQSMIQDAQRKIQEYRQRTRTI